MHATFLTVTPVFLSMQFTYRFINSHGSLHTGWEDDMSVCIPVSELTWQSTYRLLNSHGNVHTGW
jgi:hypothetical protein